MFFQKKWQFLVIVLVLAAAAFFLLGFLTSIEEGLDLGGDGVVNNEKVPGKTKAAAEIQPSRIAKMVHGVVIDADDGAAIEGAVILLTINEELQEIVSSERGEFSFQCNRRSKAQIEIAVTAAGYEMATFNDSLLQVDVLTLELRPESKKRFLQVALDLDDEGIAESLTDRCVVTIHKTGASPNDTRAKQVFVQALRDFPLTLESAYAKCDISVDVPEYVRVERMNVRVEHSTKKNPITKVTLVPSRGAEIFGWLVGWTTPEQVRDLEVIAKYSGGSYYRDAQRFMEPGWTRLGLTYALRTRMVRWSKNSDPPFSFRIRGLFPGNYRLGGTGFGGYSVTRKLTIELQENEIRGPVKLELPFGGPCSITINGSISKFIDSIKIRNRNSFEWSKEPMRKNDPAAYGAAVKSGKATFPHVALGKYAVQLLPSRLVSKEIQGMEDIVPSILRGFALGVLSSIWIADDLDIQNSDRQNHSVDLNESVALLNSWRDRIGLEKLAAWMRKGTGPSKIGGLQEFELAQIGKRSPAEVAEKFLNIEEAFLRLLDRDLPTLREVVPAQFVEHKELFARIESAARKRDLQGLLSLIFDDGVVAPRKLDPGK